MSIPQNWIQCKFSDIGAIVAGGTPSTKDEANFGGNIPWITPADLSDHKDKYISCGKRNITDKGLDNSSAILMPKGSVLFSSRAPIGYVAIAASPLATNQGFKNIIPSKQINSEYLYQYLKTCKQIAEEVASGTTFKEISTEKFGNLPFPLPPLLEQNRIVAKIDALFSEFDSGVALLKTIKAQMAIYRQAVLRWAFEGKLTGKNWDFGVLEDIVSDIKIGPFGTLLHKADYIENGIPIVNPKHMRDQKIIYDSHNTISRKKANELSSYKLQENDIVLARRGEMGRTAPVTEKEVGWLCGTGSMIIRLKEVNLNKLYSLFLSSEKVRKYLINNCKGTTMDNLNETIVKKIPVPICSKTKQQAIVSAIESRLSVCDKLEQTIDQALALSASLRQSILKRAFEGRLVPQDPNDEPAEKLLERIKAEKATVLTKQKQVRKRGKK